MRIDVKEYVKEQKDYLKTTCPKKLLIIQVGNNAASNKYVQGKIKDCEEVGYRATLVKYPEQISALMTQLADIVVTCTGHPRLITKNMLCEGAIVIDAGIAFDENNKMCGDCDPALYDDKDVFVTTVGLLTRVTLLQNLNDTD